MSQIFSLFSNLKKTRYALHLNSDMSSLDNFSGKIIDYSIVSNSKAIRKGSARRSVTQRAAACHQDHREQYRFQKSQLKAFGKYFYLDVAIGVASSYGSACG